MSLSQPDSALRLNCDHGLRRQAIVGSLLAEVFQGRLRAGQHLVTRELSARFGVSHTPVREALIALEGIGVIDLLPNRGAVVRRVTARDVREICQVRKVLECEAVRLACGRMNAEELGEIREGLRRQGEDAEASPRAKFIEKAQALDNRLHDRIAASCGNAFLANELTRLKTLFRALRDVAWAHVAERNDYQRLSDESREHLAIVDALAAHDGRAASHAMSRHILGGSKYWSQLLTDSQNPAMDPPIRHSKSV